jgi:uncharacterized repeat protein (TIGR04138 family)
MEIDWQTMRANAGPYPPQAFAFVQEGLRHTVEAIRASEPDLPEHGRHVSGQELCIGLRDYAINQYGLLARTVLDRWHIRRTDDFGRIVFAMVDAGLMRKTDEDSFDDFKGVFDFDESFETVRAAKAPVAGA